MVLRQNVGARGWLILLVVNIHAMGARYLHLCSRRILISRVICSLYKIIFLAVFANWGGDRRASKEIKNGQFDLK